MKSIFTMGFASQNFWMAQAQGPVNAAGMDYAMDLYKKVQDWVSKTSNPSDWLGSDYAVFVAQKAKADNLYPDVIDLVETLDTGGSLSTSENALANQFYDAATIAWGAIAQHPTPASAASKPAAQQTTQAITSAAQTIAKAVGPKTPTTTPTVKTAVPPPAPAPDYTTPLVIGGGALAVLLAVVAASR